LTDVLRQLKQDANPNLIVGFEGFDDAGVFLLSADLALVQTMDFFTPVVDDPYAYGQIAAANALSDVYAMGGTPVTAMNIACFDPTMAEPEVWSSVFRGMLDKCTEAGVTVVGGHTVEDREPKFGLSVTGTVNPHRMLVNSAATVGDGIWLSKPLGVGIVTTAEKQDKAFPGVLQSAIECMSTLNRAAMEAAMEAGAKCATDITGYGLAGHLWNVAKASGVRIRLSAASLPILEGIPNLIELGCVPGGAFKTRDHLAERLFLSDDVPEWVSALVTDPQTSGGLAVCSKQVVRNSTRIGEVIPGSPGIEVIA
jgi:selenide,water dikinase